MKSNLAAMPQLESLVTSCALPTRAQIIELQTAIIESGLTVEPPDPTHFFAKGMYMRELTVPAGMRLVGKIHLHEHFLIVTKGRAEVISEFGRATVEAGHLSISPAGVKRVVVALEDTQFVTIHLNPTNTNDLEFIEMEHIEPEELKRIIK
jgi:quercetin dioxygenase-like cupin family protein